MSLEYPAIGGGSLGDFSAEISLTNLRSPEIFFRFPDLYAAAHGSHSAILSADRLHEPHWRLLVFKFQHVSVYLREGSNEAHHESNGTRVRLNDSSLHGGNDHIQPNAQLVRDDLKSWDRCHANCGDMVFRTKPPQAGYFGDAGPHPMPEEQVG
jgi:hypothetical protein